MLLAAAFEDIRLRYGGPIAISSGYRPEAYNRAIGGARFSQHVQGRALDLRPVQGNVGSLRALLDACEDSRAAGMFRGLGRYVTFVHIDVRPGNRNFTWGGSRREN